MFSKRLNIQGYPRTSNHNMSNLRFEHTNITVFEQTIVNFPHYINNKQLLYIFLVFQFNFHHPFSRVTLTNFFSPKIIKNIIFPGFSCVDCHKSYKTRNNLQHHLTYYCGKLASELCPYCDYRSHLKSNIKKHVIARHKDKFLFQF